MPFPKPALAVTFAVAVAGCGPSPARVVAPAPPATARAPVAAPCGFDTMGAFLRALEELPPPPGPLAMRQPFGACEVEREHGTRTVVAGDRRIYEVTPPGWRGAYDPIFESPIAQLRVGMLGAEARQRLDALGFRSRVCSRFESWGVWKCTFAERETGHTSCEEPSETLEFAILPGDPDPEEDLVDEAAATLIAGRPILAVVLDMPCADDEPGE